MFIDVRLLHYKERSFTYLVPDTLQSQIKPGILVKVPLQSRIVPAIVHSVTYNKKYNFEIKPIVAIYAFPDDKKYDGFIAKISQYYQVDSINFIKRIQKFLEEKEKPVKTVQLVAENAYNKIVLTDQQQQVYTAIKQSVDLQQHQTHILHGVTGSGKTEVYKKLIEDVLKKQKSIILMLPEVTLAVQFEQLLKNYFSHIPVIGFHSATLVTVKRSLWQLLLDKKTCIIIGVHLPILLPISNLGLIIVDEEHDAGYQEKKHPKIHSRDMAILKASMYQVPIVLGSATPSIQSLWNVTKRNWQLLQLKERFAGSFPKIEIVSLKQKEKRACFWITKQLHMEIQNRLERKEQTIIFLNRRGYSFFVQCLCSYVFTCKQCSVSLTLHADQLLVCHYCNYNQTLPTCCPECHLSQKDFLKKGVGTQQIVSMLQKLFPQAVIARADADTTSKKRSWQQTVQDMLEGDIDILVGTQSIAKGYHFPKVTLVGVLWADLNLHFPMYNAAETTLQQLIQVSGRAGRQSQESKIVVQTFDDHPVYRFIDETKYIQFYQQEVERRTEVGYPPYKHIAEIEIRHKEQIVAETEADIVVERMQSYIEHKKLQVEIFGPVSAVVYKVKGVYAQKIILKSFVRSNMIELFADIKLKQFKSGMFFVIDPVG
ncbi:MAG: primosomal protein N' [Epsilonproteobacteria bacterium]|nr:primosomal protein N' [Campylobacterota bacterium]